MNIKIYIVGDKIEKTFLEGIKEYEKRLSRYCKVKLQHFKNEEQLLKKLSDKTYKILVSVMGTTFTSEELAEKINQLGITGKSDVTIIIGANNLPHDELLAISPMEMDLGIKTLIMFEQIYRSYRILNNEPYHK
ncbi:23S rRNA (pseudouridine(1915)-N(3))-methyltransferase RlmH [Schinkia azotoformans]|uniref:23S rRNA (pseudouridine(1915)-N(3))-methyltransferase RlmH n=1 Tax=Schinkia azotoformans TaxID=1454 RepID=UPI002DB7EDB0|nr:23S rRNA (pseudouridine(1915)-N(3))-methyltransferase RlmH [Schinkia azotoformans]MEC1717233.1 23S rRNA (pseudouridine(1915)-N(3))-methyltransferase RlmH [Schinkia azotoformans]